MKIVCIGLAILVSALAIQIAAVSPVHADEIIVTSNTTDTFGAQELGTSGAAFSSAVINDLTSGNLSQAYTDAGISSFAAVLPNGDGTFTALPPGSPSSTVSASPTATVNLPGSVTGAGPSGFFEDFFTLPPGATSISLSGVGNVDDRGTVFLNGHVITGFDALTEFGNSSFSDLTQSDFVIGGTNTLVIADNNSGGGPSGAAFYANILYTPASSAVPEPCTMLFLGLGLAGAWGLKRKVRE
jgi:hypothetical protein